MNESSHQQCVNESANLLRNLNHLRRQHNLTHKQMAQTLGISITTWRKIEQGMMPPRLSSLVVYRATDAFGIPSFYLFLDSHEFERMQAKQILLRELSRGEKSLQDGAAVILEDAVMQFSKTP
ncbi:MAG: helix-turn-helix transcriptional regulator [Clostridia bacterium]|nr:helix-turn-helix transcriptional regulator [Clostridia bacterium]